MKVVLEGRCESSYEKLKRRHDTIIFKKIKNIILSKKKEKNKKWVSLK
jgi:hypothetical protein